MKSLPLLLSLIAFLVSCVALFTSLNRKGGADIPLLSETGPASISFRQPNLEAPRAGVFSSDMAAGFTSQFNLRDDEGAASRAYLGTSGYYYDSGKLGGAAHSAATMLLSNPASESSISAQADSNTALIKLRSPQTSEIRLFFDNAGEPQIELRSAVSGKTKIIRIDTPQETP